MGSGESSVRATHFSRPEEDEAPPDPDERDDQHISISNKMVERLVEDASLSGGAQAAAAVASVTKPSRQDYKEIMFIEKLKTLDDTHSERAGLTVEEMRAMHKRIEMRTANMAAPQNVCAGAADKVVACYQRQQSGDDVLKCWDTVLDYSRCVQQASAERLYSRNVREAREQARRSRTVAQAREHALKDIAPKRQPESLPS